MAFWMDRKRDDFGVKGGWRECGAIEEGRLNITFIFSTRRSPYCHLHLPLLFISSCKTGIFNIWIESSRPELLFRCWKAGVQCEFGFISDLSKVFGVMQWSKHLYFTLVTHVIWKYSMPIWFYNDFTLINFFKLRKGKATASNTATCCCSLLKHSTLRKDTL